MYFRKQLKRIRGISIISIPSRRNKAKVTIDFAVHCDTERLWITGREI
jgi:hypothetical protein